MDQIKWSRWFSLQGLDLSMIPGESGLYQIRWSVNGNPQLIPRANDTDNSGLLYIGKTINLKHRIRSFKRGLSKLKSNNVSYTHTAIYTYSYYGFNKIFKPENLEIRWAEKGKDLIDYWEEKILGDYVEKFLDSPPLNISIQRM